jgi:hypothetical protein
MLAQQRKVRIRTNRGNGGAGGDALFQQRRSGSGNDRLRGDRIITPVPVMIR